MFLKRLNGKCQLVSLLMLVMVVNGCAGFKTEPVLHLDRPIYPLDADTN